MIECNDDIGHAITSHNDIRYTTGQSECSEDEAMFEGMGEGLDHDETSSSSSESEQELEPGQDPKPDQQPELDPRSEQPELEQDQELSQPQRVRHPPRMFTYNTEGQPTICSVQMGSNLVPGWCYPPFQ